MEGAELPASEQTGRPTTLPSLHLLSTTNTVGFLLKTLTVFFHGVAAPLKPARWVRGNEKCQWEWKS